MLHLIAINEYSSTPKYLQIVNAIRAAIKNKDVLPGQRLPSIHDLSSEFDVSRQTVEFAYNLLKKKELIVSTQGKGYYVTYSQLGNSLNVFLLFNKLSAHKQLIYEAFMDELGMDATVDFFVYNNNFGLFKKLLQQRGNHYTHYVIIAHFYEGSEKAPALINTLPKHKVVLLDKLVEGVTGEVAAVVQNFQKDLLGALTEALPLLRKYKTLNILFPAYSYQPKAILNGFYCFCTEHGFQMRMLTNIETETIQPANAYILLMEEDLVKLVKKVKDAGYHIGQQVGILSYNETPLKELLLDGLTVMTTDFAQMGRTAARMIVEGRREQVENPFRLVVRKSL